MELTIQLIRGRSNGYLVGPVSRTTEGGHDFRSLITSSLPPFWAAIVNSLRRSSALEVVDLPVSSELFRLRLTRVAAGRAMPRHTHAGAELTLVLSGGLSDGAGHFQRGDVDSADASTDHQPTSAGAAQRNSTATAISLRRKNGIVNGAS
jgi:ChrR Cupin-like domain